jgi:hypothetical protein
MKRHQSNVMRHPSDRAISRRTAIKMMGLGAATTVFTSCTLNSKQAGGQTAKSNPNQSEQLITKIIPRTNESIPAIGMGTFLTFDVMPEQPRAHLQQVMRRGMQVGVCSMSHRFTACRRLMSANRQGRSA